VERAALPRGLSWQLATVVANEPDTARVHNLVLDCPTWTGARAGQHVDVRLTADDGYEAQRSYSIASAPEDEHLMLTVERLDDGEVSPYLVDVLRPGDQLELRGPIGGFFVWESSLGGPLQLLGGGSGVVPLRAMLRHRAATANPVPARLLYSARSLDEVIYRDELQQLDGSDGVQVRLTLTRAWPEDWTGDRGRVDATLLQRATFTAAERPRVYICGPNGFVEAAANALVTLGHAPERIRTERFGPS